MEQRQELFQDCVPHSRDSDINTVWVLSSRLHFCLTTSLRRPSRCVEIHGWVPIDRVTLLKENPSGLYDSPNPTARRRVNLKGPLLDDEGNEIPIYDKHGNQVPRMDSAVDENQPACGVLVDLKDIQTLFNPNTYHMAIDRSDEDSSSAYEDAPYVRVEAYPLAFLRTAGNIKATGIPSCFYPVLTDINRKVRKNNPTDETADDGDDAMVLTFFDPASKASFVPIV